MGVTSYYSFGGEIIGEETGGVRRDYLTDALGSITATVTGAGTIENTYRYKPYGEQLAKTGAGSDPKFLWNGKSGFRTMGKKLYVRYSSTIINIPYKYLGNNSIRFVSYFGIQSIKQAKLPPMMDISSCGKCMQNATPGMGTISMGNDAIKILCGGLSDKSNQDIISGCAEWAGIGKINISCLLSFCGIDDKMKEGKDIRCIPGDYSGPPNACTPQTKIPCLCKDGLTNSPVEMPANCAFTPCKNGSDNSPGAQITICCKYFSDYAPQCDGALPSCLYPPRRSTPGLIASIIHELAHNCGGGCGEKDKDGKPIPMPPSHGRSFDDFAACVYWKLIRSKIR